MRNLSDANITDERYMYHIPSDDGRIRNTTISSSTWKIPYNGAWCENDIEYRVTATVNGTAKIYLPNNPNSTYICGVVFTAGSKYTGCEFYKGTGKITPAIIGDSTKIVSKRYNLIIWWDGSKYWVACKYS